MKQGRVAGIITAAAVLLLCAPAPSLARDNICNFQARGLSMAFGTLDPSSNLTKTVPVAAATFQADRVGDCASGNTMILSGGPGQNFSGGSRNMKNAAGDLIPYTLTGLPQSGSGPGNKNYVTFTFNGTVAGIAYQDASAGAYSDTVTIIVIP